MAGRQIVSDDSPMLGGLADHLITGNEPMLGRFDMRRLGSTQQAFLGWLQEQFRMMDEISLLAAWRWVDDWTGNAYVRRKRREQAKHWTSARLARLLHSFIWRGLILVVKHEDGYSFIRARDGIKGMRGTDGIIDLT